MKNKLFFFSGLILAVSCSPSDPKSMAKEYCDCIQNSVKSTDKQDCAELAKRHYDQLSQDPDKLNQYADELVNCTNVRPQ